jgi:hypothetical protein
MEKKIELLTEIVANLKDGFVFKKIADISKHIRTILCDYICKLSKKFFVELFDKNMIGFFPFFLVDSNIGIKSKYLGLIYEKMESNNEENDTSVTKTVISILTVARDAILNICIKEEKNLAKQGIKIIELLSQHKLLEIKTVHSMLPHLFNPEPTIRILISKVVLNYILNFKDTGSVNNKQNNDDDDEEEDSGVNKSEEVYVFTIDNLIEVCEFFFKLSNNEEKLVKVLIDDFFKHLKIFEDFGLFYNLIDYLLNYNNDNINENLYPLNFGNLVLLKTCIIILNLSIDKIQTDIENNITAGKINLNDNLIPKNENFINYFLNSVPDFIKKTRVTPNCGEVFNELLNLFTKFKIYNQNLIKFNEENLFELISVLKNSFFKTVRLEEGNVESFNKSVEGIVKAISKLMSNRELNSLGSGYTNIFDKLIYNELAREFYECFEKEILSNDFYKGNTASNTIELDKVYIVLTQLNHLIIHFKHIIRTLNYNKLFSFLTNLFRKYIVPSTLAESELYEKLGLLILTLADTIHYIYFNESIEESVLDHNNGYVNYRQNFIEFLMLVIKNLELNFQKENFEVNSVILKLKTKSLSVMLELFIYITSDKLESVSRYTIDESLVNEIQVFIKNTFLDFFINFNNAKEDYQSDYFENEIEIKTECFKDICEKFSRLLLLNLGIFKHTSLCCVYFEAFYAIKLPSIFENLNGFVFENLLDKEICHFIKTKSTSLNILIFFVTKVTMRLFTKKSIYGDSYFNSEMGISAERLIVSYMRTMKRMKTKYKDVDILIKDKAYLENFIINSINFALSSRVEFEEPSSQENSKNSKKVEIENIKFLEIIQTYLKYALFFDESDFKNILMIFLRLSKEVELIENVRRRDIRMLEKFKSFLLGKAKLFIASGDDNAGDSKMDVEESHVQLGGDDTHMDVEEDDKNVAKEAEKKKTKVKTKAKKGTTNKKDKVKKKRVDAAEDGEMKSQITTTTKKKKT